MIHWTLRKKILCGYGVSLILTIIIFVWAFINLLHLGQASDNILKRNYKSILAAEYMMNAIDRQDNAMLLMLLGEHDQTLQQFHDHESQFLQWLGKAQDNITEAGESDVLAAIQTAYSSYLTTFSELNFSRLAKEMNLTTYREEVLPLFLSVRENCFQLKEINQTAMFQSSEHAGALAEQARWSLLVIGMVAVGLGIGFSLLLSTIIVKPLQHIMRATQKMADGNYDTELAPQSSDELGLLATEFNLMAARVKAYQELNIQQKILEQKKNDAILRNIDDGIVVVDAELKLININAMAARILEINEQECLNRHFLEAFNNESLFEYVKQTTESGKSPRIEDGKNVCSIRTGQSINYYEFSITPIRVKETEALCYAALLLRNITRLKELDRLKSEFVMIASHELRTPLTSINMSISLLRESVMPKLDAQERELLNAAHEETQRLKALVSDLLDLSKIEAGKMELDFQTVSVVPLFEKAMTLLNAQIEAKGVALSSQIRDDSAEVNADVNKITWVLTNLMANALRFTEKGGSITLSAEKVGAYLHLSVKDSGAGIPYEYQSKIFDKFVQVNDSRNTGGTGLGLAICKEIVRAHGGAIWVDSAPGEGSVFTFTLPIV